MKPNLPMQITALDILSLIREVTGPSSNTNVIPLHEPCFQGTNAFSYVQDCLESGWVSTSGKWVSEFEGLVANVTHAEHAIAVTNGTNALRLALYVVGVQPDHEVLMPSLSFVATANATSHLGAIPHFIDIEPNTLGMDPLILDARLTEIAEFRGGFLFNKETGRRISCIVPVHIFGNPAEIISICKVAAKWNLKVVEDSAEALGSFKNGIHCGLFGDLGILSFNGNKIITTGGGGVVITDNADYAKRIRHISCTAKVYHPWQFIHDEIGWNDRMPNINAALGCSQIEILDTKLHQKRLIHAFYKKQFANIEQCEIIQPTSDSFSNNWLVALRMCSANVNVAHKLSNDILAAAYDQGLQLRPLWTPLHLLAMYQNCPRSSLCNTIEQASRIINLPSSPQLYKNLGHTHIL